MLDDMSQWLCTTYASPTQRTNVMTYQFDLEMIAVSFLITVICFQCSKLKVYPAPCVHILVIHFCA